MRQLKVEEMEVIQGESFCDKAGGLLAGVGLGAAGLTYFGIITVATGGTVGLVVAAAGVGLGMYCAR